ncbi:MAG: Na/Pi cotransporter family protein [Gammaproteobacteria bacterium]|nr:Na/Pi cotransporter family protein [Gammaproteobacteria bacterium]
MIRNILLPTIFLLLTYGFWLSPDFKEISAGVAIFLFGMLALEEGFKAFTGGTLERLLRRTTNQLWKSISFGVVTTTLMQSSSLVSVITISFLSAELITLAAGIGIIFGANLGTTTGAWLVAGFGLKVKLSAYAMPMLVFGVTLIFQKSRSLKGVGYILAGMGFLFLGIHYMKEGFEAFKQTLDLAEYAIPGYAGLFIFALIGIMATVIMQSSHATLVLVLTALAAQQITYDNALALAIGSNVGTTITAILGAMSSNVQGKRLAGAHLIFNMTTGIIAIVIIQQLILLVDLLSNGLGIAADNYTLKLAIFHTLFNLLGIIIMVPFITRLVSFLERIIATPAAEIATPRYLYAASAEIPDAAIEAVRKETARLYNQAVDIITHGLSLQREILLSEQPLEEVVTESDTIKTQEIDHLYNKYIKAIYGAIIEFISHAQNSVDKEQVEEFSTLRQAGHNIVEAIKGIKHLQKNLSIYMASDNPHIRHEYNNIRIQIAHVLRELEILQNGADEAGTILSLDQLKMEISERDVISTGVLDSLIRKNHISAQMATSLMNDSAYCQNICRNLIHLGETLFAASDPDEKEAERSVALNEAEIKEVLNNYSEEKN